MWGVLHEHMYSCVVRVVPLVGGPCSLCRRVERRSSGGRQNRRGCRSSASPPPVYPWSGETHYPATGSPGTHTHIHTRTHTHGTQAGRPELHAGANMCTCGHARTENTQGNAYTIERVIKLLVCTRRYVFTCFFYGLTLKHIQPHTLISIHACNSHNSIKLKKVDFSILEIMYK